MSQTNSSDHFYLSNSERVSVQAKILGLTDITISHNQPMETHTKTIQLGEYEAFHVLLSSGKV